MSAELIYTEHAKERMAQRVIKPSLIRHVLLNGTRSEARNGAIVFELPASLDGTEINGCIRVVVADGAVITAYARIY